MRQGLEKTNKENHGTFRHDFYNVVIPYKIAQQLNLQDSTTLYSTLSEKTRVIRLHTKQEIMIPIERKEVKIKQDTVYSEPTCGYGTVEVNGMCQVIQQPQSEPPRCGPGTQIVNGFCKVIPITATDKHETSKQTAINLQEILDMQFRVFLDMLMNR